MVELSHWALFQPERGHPQTVTPQSQRDQAGTSCRSAAGKREPNRKTILWAVETSRKIHYAATLANMMLIKINLLPLFGRVPIFVTAKRSRARAVPQLFGSKQTFQNLPSAEPFFNWTILDCCHKSLFKSLPTKNVN